MIGENSADNKGIYTYSVAATKDGGYVVGGSFKGKIQVGEYILESNGTSDGIIIKYTAEGEVEWVNSMGGKDDRGNDVIYSLNQLEDGGILVGGSLYERDIHIGNYYFEGGYQRKTGIIIKYTESGEVDWATSLEENNGNIKSVIETKNGKMIASGDFANKVVVEGKELISNGGTDGIIINFERKEMENPIMTYATTVGGTGTDYISSTVATKDGGYIAIGYFSTYEMQIGESIIRNNGRDDCLIIKYNFKDEIEWVRTFGGGGYDSIYSVTETADGGIVVGGYFRSLSIQLGKYTLTNVDDKQTGMIIKYTSYGEVEWATAIKGISNEDYRSTIDQIVATNDGGFVARRKFLC